MKMLGQHYQQKKLKIAVWLLFALLIGPFFGSILYWCWHDTQSPIALFIVPDEFRGSFRIIEDPKTGINVPFVHNKYIYRIPPSGLLVVKSLTPFTNWGVNQAQYAGGKPITCAAPDPDNKVAPTEIALRGGGPITSNTEPHYYMEFTIGTEDDVSKSPENSLSETNK